MQGWHPDPFGRHGARYFSQGVATRLVRDGTTESYDEPPAATPDQGAVAPGGAAHVASRVPVSDVGPYKDEPPLGPPPSPPPGWYPDPLAHGRARFWTGEVWSEHSELVATLVALSQHEPERLAELSR